MPVDCYADARSVDVQVEAAAKLEFEEDAKNARCQCRRCLCHHRRFHQRYGIAELCASATWTAVSRYDADNGLSTSI